MSPSVSHAPWRGAAVGTVCEIAGVAFRISSADSESVPLTFYLLPPLSPAPTCHLGETPGAPRGGVYARLSGARHAQLESFNNVERVRARLLVASAQSRRRASENLNLFLYLLWLSLCPGLQSAKARGSPSPPALQSQVVQRSASPTQCATTLPLPLAGALTSSSWGRPYPSCPCRPQARPAPCPACARP